MTETRTTRTAAPKPNLVGRYRPLGIGAVLAAAMMKAPASA